MAPLKENGQLHSDSQKRSEILARQFKSVFTQDGQDPHKDDVLEGPAYPPINELAISEAGVHKLLATLKPRKAAGPDQIPCRLLKELADELAPVVTNLYRQSMNTGDLPSRWSTAWITPVFKKGARNNPENYRPISLTCVLSKLMEHIVSTHIRGHLDKYGALTPLNHGFRSRHSCESQLLLTTHDLYTRLDEKKQVDMAILDFSKAFDTVPHQRLLNKLRLYGIGGQLHQWISSFLIGRSQSVLIDGARSQVDSVDSGVPQGTVLGPLLFLLFINDLPSVLDPGTAVRLFADDCLVYRSIDSEQDQLLLQQDLDALNLWGQCWGMRFNTKKCQVMHIGKQSRHHFYQLNNEILTTATEVKYLGITLTDDLKWSTHVKQTSTKAHQRLGFVKRNLKGSPYKHREMAYTSLVRSPISPMEYCGAIWDPVLKRDMG